jgi:hypothetical protein
VIKPGPVDPDIQDAVDTLAAWQASGAHRRDADADGTYDDAQAVELMDAWWPLLLKAEFKPTLGKALFDRMQGMIAFDDTPHKTGSNQGSAYNGGWYGYVQKDLRTILGRHVRGRYSRTYCGKGSLSRCRKALQSSLAKAIEIPYATVYADADSCSGGDAQWCYDAVEHRALGAITQPSFHWINRPTFQAGRRDPRRLPIGLTAAMARAPKRRRA